MLLRELEAFEACWFDLKDTYPTTRQDNTLIAHSMGQIVDLVEKPDQVEKSLPDHLKILFRRLAIAYFQGYIPHRARTSTPSVPMAPPVRPVTTTTTAVKTTPETLQKQETTATRQKQEISAAVEQVRRLANQAQARMQRSQVNRDCPVPAGCSIADMDTLIVDFPEHWHTDS
ncbi:hypothetical protein [Phormidium sp. FACHB-1136]|uniref:hypothetical protein n=1 Tax=Phormidium sp. FACHB-1136 TaxID=2692848 RepID=UPI001689B7A9|nr:hypothetical protein [Phormidium sp. FACHB-1136]MBD2425270.1 hypothetical protein [Phormidium sp. FACHB-1136]